MGIKYTLENLEGVDEAHKPLYKEAEGGGFVLDVEGAVGADKFAALNQKAVDNATEAQRRRKTVERITGKLGIEDAGEIDAALDVLISNQGKGGKSSEEQEAIIAQIKQEAESRIAASESRYTGVLVDAAVSEAKSSLQAAGFPEKVAEMLAKTSKDRLQVDDGGKVRIMAENGNPMAGSGGDGYATYGDFAKEMAAAMPDLLTDRGKGGGGKAPATGGGGAAPNGKFGSLAAKVPGFADLPES